ncbi:MAG: gliding motility-associated C-terminal domain-containing protein [Bacteroidales bacterium]|nr:gliding motility-associated C-terminal domain-containing protein [Bacteroidales bacterium]
MKKTFIILIFSFISIFSYSQVTENYHTPFETNNQNLWQAGTGGLFEINHVFFDEGFNNSITFGPIYNVAGFDFGASISAGAWAQVGAGLQINFGTEQVDIDYDANMHIVRPPNFSFDPGEQLIINTSFTPTPPPGASNIVTDVYDANMRLYLKFGMGLNLSANVCVFGCSNIDILDLNLPTREYDMVSVSSLNGISLLDGMFNWPVGGVFPFHYEDPYSISTTDINLPSNAGATTYLDGNELHSFLNPINSNDSYFKLYFSIPNFIGALHIPYVSAVFANLSNSWEAGPIYLNYTLLEAGFRVALFHKQHLILDPTMKGKFNFETDLDYEVINPTNGNIIAQGYGSEIDYTVGDRIKIDYPCNYDFIEVTPSFEMENTFTNHTYDSIALDFVFEMLTFNLGMNSVTVIPQICIPIYYPCPTWSNPLKFCKKTVCTPEVVFDGFDVGFGPLVDWQPNLFNIKYDWCNNNWAMQGFNSFPNQTPFRLEPRKFSVDLNVTDVLCYGDETGTATATVTNGNPPYIYEWSNGEIISTNQTTNTQTGLPAGTHWVIVRDTKNCSVFDSKVIVEPEAALAISFDVVNPNCFASNDGSIDINITGGTQPYSYNWSNSETTEDISNLDAGDFSVTVTDDNSCSLTQSFVLIKPEDILVTVSSENVSCYGENTGSIELEVYGGVEPYSYLWNTGSTASSDMNLPVGTYQITISDVNGCKKYETIDITGPANPLSKTSTLTDVLCYGDSNGSIDVTVSGGTPPYSYLWYNSDFNIINQTSSALVNVPAGTYQLIIYDALLCSDTSVFIVNQPDSLYYEFEIQDVLCKGLAQGEVTLTVSGATPPYTFEWSNGENTETISNLVAGEYFVTVTDFNNCVSVLSTFINQPAEELMVETKPTDVLCYGAATGTVSAIINGGTSPYTYLWSNNETTINITDVVAGTYTITVTDAHNCIAYSGGVVNEPELPLAIEHVVTPVSCFGYGDGAIDITMSGGTIPYSLIWDDNTYVFSTNQQSIDNIFTGIYNIRIKDANNCFIISEFAIMSPDSVTIDFVSNLVSCFNGFDGSLTPTITGGTEPYSYEWSNGDNTEELSNVSAGTYDLTVSDANDCEYSESGVVESFTEIFLTSEIIPVTCKDLDDAAINVVVEGGTGNYFFVWSNGLTVQNVDNLAPGQYTLTVSDDNKCESLYEFEIEPNYIECLNIPSSFSPNNDGINDTWVIRSIDTYSDARVQIFNKWGRILFESTGTYTPWDGTFNGNQLPSETYYYIVDLNNGDSPYTGTITILR